MSDPQKAYRAYSYDGVRQALAYELIEAATDEEAIREAEAMGFATRCEIWEGHRLVAELGTERRSA
ncbi:MAG: hypothetical protein JO335_12095 [Sphingomonas sp.]|nr:hypothetical protein [Sphingomonas sp.]